MQTRIEQAEQLEHGTAHLLEFLQFGRCALKHALAQCLLCRRCLPRRRFRSHRRTEPWPLDFGPRQAFGERICGRDAGDGPSGVLKSLGLESWR